MHSQDCNFFKLTYVSATSIYIIKLLVLLKHIEILSTVIIRYYIPLK